VYVAPGMLIMLSKSSSFIVPHSSPSAAGRAWLATSSRARSGRTR
jgi:hypothetical protein